ncbi:protein of unknown function [Streptomyces sp. yr375]|uniref:DUF397 domain-containing protein n=1 Tax=Streptomyces sp. yr375 TaxID=1761906 RepID=UPI0008B21328|nr:DUF397 domain-containing protein [Streptomyces sp. yr375]SER43630.1 protein of unknown function [Streptomyces sp. yr375]
MSTTELHWFKSSYSSGPEPGDCVEIALDWFKSSYSDNNEPGDCVEVATTPATIHVRDSKNPAHGKLAVSRAAWVGFVAHAAQ